MMKAKAKRGTRRHAFRGAQRRRYLRFPLAAFGGSASVTVSGEFTPAAIASAQTPVVIADRTLVHEARAAKGLWTGGGIAGSHSDIYFSEVYSLVSGFLFS